MLRHLLSHNRYYTALKSNLEQLHIFKKGCFINVLKEFEIYETCTKINSGSFVLNDQVKLKSNQLNDTALNLLYQIETNSHSVVNQT